MSKRNKFNLVFNEISDIKQCLNNNHCLKMEYRCIKSGFCIKLNYVCDGIFDCPSKEDEEICEESNFTFFQCLTNAERVSYAQVCDFVFDCSDKSDEDFCG